MHHFKWDLPSRSWLPEGLPTLVPYGSTHTITANCPLVELPPKATQAQEQQHKERSVEVDLSVCLGQVGVV